MYLELSNDEFEIVKKALGRASYSTLREREEVIKLGNRLSNIHPEHGRGLIQQLHERIKTLRYKLDECNETHRGPETVDIAVTFSEEMP